MTSERSPLLDDVASSNSSESNLLRFRRAIGIHTEPFDDMDLESARKSAKGLYKEVIRVQRFRNRQHRVFEGVFYAALGTQIIIGATLTSLGPQSEAHSQAITILGICNTGIAGLLTILKGQGLPDRFRKDEYQMKKVQDFIEEMDVRLSLGGADEFTAQELDEVVQQVFEKYNMAVDTAELNKPSSYATQKESVKGRNRNGQNSSQRFSSLLDDNDGKGKGKLLIG